mgnify:FL=1|jgi:hypothetical protein
MKDFIDLIEAEIQVKISSADNLLEEALGSSITAEMAAKEELANAALHYLEGMLKTLKLLNTVMGSSMIRTSISDLEKQIRHRKTMVF